MRAVMTGGPRNTGGFAARHRKHAIAFDAGADTVRLLLPGGELTAFHTPVAVARQSIARSDATASIVEASRHAIYRRLPRVTRRRRGGFRVVATVPARASTTARRRLEAVLLELNRDQPVLLMDAPLAAAAGSGVETASSLPRVVLDVGGHGSEAAVIAEGRVLDAIDCPEGCHDIEHAILTHLSRRHHVLATPRAAEPVAMPVNRSELAAEISDPTTAIIRTVRRLTERAAAVLDRDPLQHDVLLVGGGALVPQLARMLRTELGTHVQVPHDPRNAAVRGVGLLLVEADRYPRLWDA